MVIAANDIGETDIRTQHGPLFGNQSTQVPEYLVELVNTSFDFANLVFTLLN
jgi:hypothetical protein